MDQSLLNRILVIIEIIGGLNVIFGMAVGIFVAWSNQKTRADVAEMNTASIAANVKLRDDVIDRLDKKLDEYLRTSRFKDYQESHAKEHLEIQSEITRFRDWKHQVAEPMLRKHDTVLAIGKDKD